MLGARDPADARGATAAAEADMEALCQPVQGLARFLHAMQVLRLPGGARDAETSMLPFTARLSLLMLRVARCAAEVPGEVLPTQLLHDMFLAAAYAPRFMFLPSQMAEVRQHMGDSFTIMGNKVAEMVNGLPDTATAYLGL